MYYSHEQIAIAMALNEEVVRQVELESEEEENDEDLSPGEKISRELSASAE